LFGCPAEGDGVELMLFASIFNIFKFSAKCLQLSCFLLISYVVSVAYSFGDIHGVEGIGKYMHCSGWVGALLGTCVENGVSINMLLQLNRRLLAALQLFFLVRCIGF
jgi:hypothetical protein